MLGLSLFMFRSMTHVPIHGEKTDQIMEMFRRFGFVVNSAGGSDPLALTCRQRQIMP